MNRSRYGGLRRTLTATSALTFGAAIALTGCSAEGGSGEDTVGVSLIVKTTTNPFFVSMQEGAEAAAEEIGVELTFAAGRQDGDEDTQIQAIENAISRGDKGILITPNGPGVEDALTRARDAGLYVIALDTPPSDPESVDITFATDNFLAGQRIGEWTAAQLGGERAVIAMIDLFDDKVVSVDVQRDQGFLDGMGIDLADAEVIGDEAATGQYSGGEYEIVGHEASDGAEDGGRTAAENLLSINPDINVVYTINEPAAYGAYEAFDAASATEDLIVASVDGGCAGVTAVTDGVISATSQQYPVRMAELGVEAIHALATTGEAPEASEGLDFFNTGVELVTDQPHEGIESITSTEAGDVCWG
ncbi:substrate-binding domain-containing protein [Glycomyces algeriensis]|uniref:Sugar ABC transporter n=1 Tax=Glycomyces algeriensis TaxID=256037 RepID=A0A9W6G9V0_9ACTN|nr:substrate-binding domain-containing protein [Glycomyces algeriensis]MDA1364166.1 substrate-binding domain-containing protein [Glycomyces algeriensis]MDR7350191.1 fructose transport system substrate-binding protein [Glycomyces algeriensis]GLI42903.1 sugar ABC transporter [Glycomyces algeriensis]